MLVLIPKHCAVEGVAFKRIFLIDVVAKVFEKIITERLKKELERLFGFREGKSTIDAIQGLVGMAKYANSGNWRSRELCIAIALDIKNAFNLAPWRLDLLARERHYNHQADEQSRKYYRDMLIDRWQQRWDNTHKGRWTNTLNPDVGVWHERKHGHVNYYLFRDMVVSGSVYTVVREILPGIFCSSARGG